MSAAIVLHPRSVEIFGLFPMASTLKTRGYEVREQPGTKYITAQPETLVPQPEPRWLWWPKPQR